MVSLFGRGFDSLQLHYVALSVIEPRAFFYDNIPCCSSLQLHDVTLSVIEPGAFFVYYYFQVNMFKHPMLMGVDAFKLHVHYNNHHD